MEFLIILSFCFSTFLYSFACKLCIDTEKKWILKGYFFFCLKTLLNQSLESTFFKINFKHFFFIYFYGRINRDRFCSCFVQKGINDFSRYVFIFRWYYSVWWSFWFNKHMPKITKITAVKFQFGSFFVYCCYVTVYCYRCSR